MHGENFHVVLYHWQELPQVSVLLQQKFCLNKTCLLLPQKYACHDRTFVVTNIVLLQDKFCYGKHTFVATNICHDKHVFVATKVLS